MKSGPGYERVYPRAHRCKIKHTNISEVGSSMGKISGCRVLADKLTKTSKVPLQLGR